MSESEAYVYSSDNYTGVYCLPCATEAWKDDARKIFDNGCDADEILRELRDMNRPSWLSESECSDRGETCETCYEEVCPPYYHCDGCDHSGWIHEGFGEPEQAGCVDDDGEGPHTSWCEECADQNGLLADDGRGYVLRFVENYAGELTYRQADGRSWVDDPTPVYRAGCRRFTLADALRHWGREHYTNTSGDGYETAYVRDVRDGYLAATPADALANAVLRHAMRRALPRIVIPAERAAEATTAA